MEQLREEQFPSLYDELSRYDEVYDRRRRSEERRATGDYDAHVHYAEYREPQHREPPRPQRRERHERRERYERQERRDRYDGRREAYHRGDRYDERHYRDERRRRRDDYDDQRPPRKKKKKSSAGPYIAIIIVLALAFAFLRIWLAGHPSNIDPVAGNDAAAGFLQEERINVLMLGTNGGLSDTMMVFSIDTVNKIVDEISVPRDTYYERPDYPGAAYQKINSVLSTEGYVGCANAVSDVLCGIPIHYYVELTDDSVRSIVNAMGGVEMDVPMDMQYVDVDQNLYIDLRAGRQVLNGDQAVQFLRFRSGYATGDLGRVSAQQEFVKAVVRQGLGFDLPKVLMATSKSVETNINFVSVLGMLPNVSALTDGTFRTWMVPGVADMRNGASYYFADRAATQAMIDQIYVTPQETTTTTE